MKSVIGSIALLATLALGSGTAWAGGGGADFPGLQNALTNPSTGVCHFLQMTSCPQLPTITQLVLEIAGLENAPPEVVRFENGISRTAAVGAVNPQAGSPSFPPANVTPLAFISPPPGGSVAQVTDLGDPDANSFFYAALNGDAGTPPDTLFLFYDYPPLTNQTFTSGQFVANILVPLVFVGNKGNEIEAPTTIQIRGASGCSGNPCVSFTAVGNFGSGPKSVDPSTLGLTVALTFGTSPNSSSPMPHAIFEVQAKLLVTHAHDPAYFGNDPAYASNPLIPVFFPEAFTNDELGGGVPKLAPIGVGPYAVPQCPNGVCATPPLPSNFSLCASIAQNSGVAAPAVAAFYALGTVGTTYLSTPRVQPAGVTCPF